MLNCVRRLTMLNCVYWLAMLNCVRWLTMLNGVRRLTMLNVFAGLQSAGSPMKHQVPVGSYLWPGHTAGYIPDTYVAVLSPWRFAARCLRETTEEARFIWKSKH